jgi:dTDP-4-dehydrorhamnose 3,5-epimerase
MAVRLITPKRFGDARGWFAETYSRQAFQKLGIDVDFCQDNHSMSADIGVLRGLHFQRPPHAQAKLVRCIRGRIFDVAVDVRTGSPTFAKWFAVELSAENGRELFVPVGFAHGFVTLEPNTEVEYKVSAPYAPAAEAGIIWNDSAVAISWPLPPTGPSLSAKDKILPPLAQLGNIFAYDGKPAELIQI